MKWVSAACDTLVLQPDLLSQLPPAAQTGRLILHLTEEDPDTGDVCTLGRWKIGLCDGKLTYLRIGLNCINAENGLYFNPKKAISIKIRFTIV